MNRFCCFLFATFVLSTTTQAQNLETNLETYATDYIQERAHIHFDKVAYMPGETIWFKVYLMEGPYPAELSKNFYIDWTDDKGKVLGRSVSPLIEGATNGQFDIPENFKGQFVHARGYTRWMMNFDSSFLYDKDVRVIQKTITKGTATADVYTFNIFPEGGDIINGLVNKIAFKAHDQQGYPIAIKGTLVNQAGKVIDSVKSMHDGMGLFYITPKAGESFKVKWKDPKGKERETALPAIKSYGLGLQVSTVRDRKFFQVNVMRDKNFDPGIVHVLGTMNGSQIFLVSKDSKEGEVKGVVPTGELPSGILTITVFDDQWKPMAERITMVYNSNNSTFPVSYEVKHWGMNKRARNDIEITVPNELYSNLSVSITDASISSDSSDNIISRLLLTGDLRGNVHKPGYYFSNYNDSTARHLDLVMLTHGWRKIKWEDISKGIMPAIKYARDTSYFTLQGRVYGATPTELRETGEIMFIIQQKNKEGGFAVTKLKADGTFDDPSMLLFDSTTVYHQFGNGKKLSGASVRYLETKLPPPTKTLAATGVYSSLGADTTGFARQSQISAEEAAFLKQFEGKMLEGVVVKAKTKSRLEEMDDKYTSGLFTSVDAYQFDLVNDPFAAAQMNIFTFLQGKVAGLQVNNAASQSPSLSWRGGTPQIYLNEVPADVSMIASMSVMDVAYVKVFRPPFMGGFNGANGAIAIYTRRGDDIKSEPGKGLSSSMVSGYSEIREFYSPNYSMFTKDNDKRDMRTTLYWNPMIITEPGKSRLQFSFYNTDITEAFRIVIEGMSKDGKLTRLEDVIF